MFLNIKPKITLVNLSDSELLSYYASALNQNYLAELFNRYSHLIFLVCKKYLGDRDSAKDMTMNIYEKLIEILKYQKVNNFKSWVYSVAKNECLMFLRKNDALNKKAQFFNIDTMESEDFLNQEDEKLFTSDVLHKKVEELEEEQRECIKHFYFNKSSYKEIAQKISMTEKKVKSCLQNGKRNLKIALLQTVEEG